jgi:hypothetical protein
MIAKLFDIQNNKVVPTVHCHTITWLKNIMEEYKEDDEYLKVYQYLYYMRFPNPDENPYFHFKASEKEEQILSDIEANFSSEDDMIVHALNKITKMYETPTSRAYDGIAGMMDKLARFMKTEEITTGRDGNMAAIISAAKSYDQIRQSFKGAFKDLQEEQQSRVRGDKGLGYDQQ